MRIPPPSCYGGADFVSRIPRNNTSSNTASDRSGISYCKESASQDVSLRAHQQTRYSSCIHRFPDSIVMPPATSLMNNRLSYQTTERPYTFTRGTIIRASAHGCFGSGNPSDGGVLWKSLHREQWPICLRRKTTRESIKNGGALFCVGVESSYLT